MIEPRGGVIQTAFLVRPGGLMDAIDYWVKAVGAGPFFVGSFPLSEQRYLGQPTDMQAVVAVGYHGDCQLELIEPTNEAPGPYMAALKQHAKIPRGGVYHHIMLDTDDYAAAYRHHLDHGCTEAFAAVSSSGKRIAYLDASETIGGYIELLEPNPVWQRMCAEMREITRNWDGADPTRAFDTLETMEMPAVTTPELAV